MPDYNKVIKKVKQEMPDQAATSVEPSGFLGRFLSRGANASTNPFTGSVSFNPDMMDKMSPDEMENTFTHELTHSRQVQDTPFLSRFGNVAKSMLPGFLGGGDEEYYQRPRELEAFQAEKNRTLSHNLRDMPDPMNARRDINLPSESPMAISKRKAMFDRLRGVR